jgi:hypothetical protein
MMKGLSIGRTPSTNFSSSCRTLNASDEFPQIGFSAVTLLRHYFSKRVRNKKSKGGWLRQAPTVRDEVHGEVYRHMHKCNVMIFRLFHAPGQCRNGVAPTVLAARHLAP